MNNLYEKFIRETLAQEQVRACRRIQASRFTVDLTVGSRVDHWRSLDLGLAGGMLDPLAEESRQVVDLSSFFVLNPKVDCTRSSNLELLPEHYQPHSVAVRGVIRFSFSPVVTSDATGVSLFYASYQRGFLWAAGFLCVASPAVDALNSQCVVGILMPEWAAPTLSLLLR